MPGRRSDDRSSRFRRALRHAKVRSIASFEPAGLAPAGSPLVARSHAAASASARNSSSSRAISKLRIALIFASLFVRSAIASALFSAVARGQGLRCRADRHHPVGADVPARRHDAVHHRHGRPGEGPRQCADRCWSPRRWSCRCGYFLPPTYAIVLAVSLALSVVWTPHSPLTNSLALSGVRRFGSNYTSMRIWGSIAFLARQLRRRHHPVADERRRPCRS